MKRINTSLLADHVGINEPHYKRSLFYDFPHEPRVWFPTAVSHADQYEAHNSAPDFVDLRYNCNRKLFTNLLISQTQPEG